MTRINVYIHIMTFDYAECKTSSPKLEVKHSSKQRTLNIALWCDATHLEIQIQAHIYTSLHKIKYLTLLLTMQINKQKNKPSDMYGKTSLGIPSLTDKVNWED